jgi:hypothetical protein
MLVILHFKTKMQVHEKRKPLLTVHRRMIARLRKLP